MESIKTDYWRGQRLLSPPPSPQKNIGGGVQPVPMHMGYGGGGGAQPVPMHMGYGVTMIQSFLNLGEFW